jgi:hypothetical protein
VVAAILPLIVACPGVTSEYQALTPLALPALP